MSFSQFIFNRILLVVNKKMLTFVREKCANAHNSLVELWKYNVTYT